MNKIVLESVLKGEEKRRWHAIQFWNKESFHAESKHR